MQSRSTTVRDKRVDSTNQTPNKQASKSIIVRALIAMFGNKRARGRTAAIVIACVMMLVITSAKAQGKFGAHEGDVGQKGATRDAEDANGGEARGATALRSTKTTDAVAEIGGFDAHEAHIEVEDARKGNDVDAMEVKVEATEAATETRKAWSDAEADSREALATFKSASKIPSKKEFADGEPLGRGSLTMAKPVPIPKATRLRVLVTGGAGFVGSHLVDRLMERGNIVIVADNFFTGRKENIMHHLQNPFFELIRHDVVEPMLVEVDQIYHLACPASPVHYKHNPVKTIKTSVMGTLNMLGLAKRVGARMLLTSTSEVYGDPLQHPQTEDYWGNVNPIGVRSCYDEGKRVAETLCFDYHRQEGVDIRIARIFNTYGPRMALEDGRVVSNFVSQALRGDPMTIYGDGKQTRSFQYVDDLVAGLIALMDNDVEIGPVNIGNPNEFTMLELAEVVREVVNPKAQIVFKENTQDDPGRRRPDISKAKRTLGWEPKIKLRDGLPKMVDDFRERLNLPKTEL